MGKADRNLIVDGVLSWLWVGPNKLLLPQVPCYRLIERMVMVTSYVTGMIKTDFIMQRKFRNVDRSRIIG